MKNPKKSGDGRRIEAVDRRAWRTILPQLADKLMDAGNLSFAGLLLGQLIGSGAFSVRTAVLGFALWISLLVMGALLLYFAPGD